MCLEPYYIDLLLETEDVDEDAGKPLTATKRIPVLLPHEIFAELHSSSAYQDEDLVRMALAMRGLSEAQSLLDNGGLKFTGSEARKFDEMAHLHLRTWQRLAVKFEDLLIPLCNIRPKHHYLQHLARYVLRTRINIRIHQNFDSESYMGKIKRIACKCHSTSMLLRVQQCYILYLALLWDRAKRASVGGDVRGKSLEDILLLEERKPFSSTAEHAKRRCLRS
ncbi:nipblb [Symbiodinium sp. CCMP2592]|nr:nipblb [Symbiodinium sp. CCMP2592]